MKKLFLTSLILMSVITSSGQEITLNFMAKDANNQITIELSSVLVENLTLVCDTIVYGPNPSLVLPVSFGVPENNPGEDLTFRIMAVRPNPFSGSSMVTVYIPAGGNLMLTLSDAAGHVLAKYENELEAGLHNFEIVADCPGLLLLNAINDKEVKYAKLINNSNGSGTNNIRYSGQDTDMEKVQLKNASAINDDQFRFNPGDQLKYTSIAAGYNNGVIQDSPAADTTYTFQMAVIVTLPTVLTSAVTDTTQTTATCGGNVTDDGGDPVTARGVCWSNSPEPTLENSYTIDGSGTGIFTSSLTGLTPSTPYYIRAYATNSLGTAYGDQLLFSTTAVDELWKLAGDTSKIWKLIRVVNTGRYPIEVGPFDHSMIWWAMGLNNGELANRPCMLNDVWTFYPDGTMEFDANGDYWAEGGVFDPANFCASTSEPMWNIHGEDCSAWGNGTHQFELIAGSQPKLKAIGNGAYIGFFKCAELCRIDQGINIICRNGIFKKLPFIARSQ